VIRELEEVVPSVLLAVTSVLVEVSLASVAVVAEMEMEPEDSRVELAELAELAEARPPSLEQARLITKKVNKPCIIRVLADSDKHNGYELIRCTVCQSRLETFIN